ncbi:glycoside hydrolase [Streptomyces sp. A7024]|uniref:alpha-L-fucosidase n=1 Tax=Streptomyces coryli TaxID=1128680 RepID=A0A6G4TXQ4_9ACTN|nr:alpha-L-fucosidase [Streptomyces coryli]NGN64789.1 glycoside hydrolase [Streptomyces coryli]
MRFAVTSFISAFAAPVLLACGCLGATEASARDGRPPGSEPRNYAFNTPASQSSTAFGGAATRATDANRNGTWSEASVTHTDREAEPYWQTDLGASKKLSRVVIHNRTDSNAERLSNFWVLASDSPITARSLAQARNRPGVTATRVASLSGPFVELPLDRSARYLRIQLEGTDYLSLAEVQTFGDESISPSPAARRWVQGNPFGMFVHFNMSTYQNEQWAEPTASPAHFNPSHRAPREWAQAMKDAGMTFGVLTVKHHDGFALWNSKHSDYDIAASPYRDGKGDIVREYVDAMHEAGLKVGFYFSIWDRHHGDSQKLVQSQLRELLTQYGPVDYLWFDGWGWRVPYAQIPYRPVRDMIRKLSPRTVVANNDHLRTQQTTDVIVYEVPHEGRPPADEERPVDVADTMDVNDTWFNTTSTGSPRSVEDITTSLAKAKAGNGLYLLNVGPDKTGRLPQNYRDRLKEVGATR